jgi:hypothetical protein
MFKKNSLQYQLFKSLNRNEGPFLYAFTTNVLLNDKIQIIHVLIKINKNNFFIKGISENMPIIKAQRCYNKIKNVDLNQ